MLIGRAIYFGDKYGSQNASKMTRSESLMQNHFHKMTTMIRDIS